MDRVEYLIKRSGNMLAWIGFVLMLLLMIHVCLDVIGKFIFNSPIADTLEIVEAYYMVGVLFLPLAYVTYGEGHIVVELFTRNLRERTVLYLDAVIGLLTLIYCILLTWQTFVEAIFQTAQLEVREGAGYLLVVWPARWLLPLGFLAMGIYVALRIIRDYHAARTYKDTASPQAG